MKALVVYYSRTGTTKKVATEIAAALDADVEELREKADRSGKVGYMMAGRDAMRKTPAELLPLQHDPSDYDLVAIGGPCWAFTMCTPSRTYTVEHKDALKKTAFFATAASANFAQKAVDALIEATSLTPVATLALSEKDAPGDISTAIAEFVSMIRSGQETEGRHG